MCFVFLSVDIDLSLPLEEVLFSLQVDLLLPYSQLSLSSQAELPDSCLAFGLQEKPARWFYIFSEVEELQHIRSELTVLFQVRERHISRLSLIFRCSQWF